jgi:hypothetical protein
MNIATNGASIHAPRADSTTPRLDDKGEPPDRPPSAGDEKAKAAPPKAAKAAEQLVQLVVTQAALFHDARGTAYATIHIPAASGAKVAARTLRLRSRRFRSWMAFIARASNRQTVGATTLEEALTALEGIACYDRPSREVYVRVGLHEGTLYIDLGDDSGECVRVTPSGWYVVETAPVPFFRPSGLLPLVRPEHGGNVDDLRRFVNVDDDGFTLYVAWLVASYWPRPCAALVVTGEQGTAKTTASKIARRLTDPNAAELRSPPRNEDDLLIAATNSHVVALDNLSGLSGSMSDALCRLITGGGMGKRTLFSDDDETILEAMRPVLLNGIEDVADRPDLAERCIALTLLPITERVRRDEASFWRDFDAAAPRILGALLDGIVAGVANVDKVQLPTLPRMADFIRFATAAEAGLGLKSLSIVAAFERNRALVVAAALEASPVAAALRRLLSKRGGTWVGTPTELLSDLVKVASSEAPLSRGWPSDASHLSGKLRRIANPLRQIGVEITEGHRNRGAQKERTVTIATTESRRDVRPGTKASSTRKRGTP